MFSYRTKAKKLDSVESQDFTVESAKRAKIMTHFFFEEIVMKP